MGSFLDKAFRITSLVLIIALLFNVYNSHVQIVEGIGQQEPVKITGMLAANLSFCGTHIEQQSRDCKNFFSPLEIKHYATGLRQIIQGKVHLEYTHRISFKAEQVIEDPAGWLLAMIQVCYPLG